MTSWQEQYGDNESRLKYLLDTGILFDCEFLVGPSRIPLKGHKVVLGMVSPVLKKKLMEAGSDPVIIDDVLLDVFQLMFEYIYTNKVDIPSEDMACQLAEAARAYKLPYLERQCFKYIIEILTPENVVQAYEMARRIKDDTLIEECEEVIAGLPEDVLQNYTFLEASVGTVEAIFALDPMDINSELDLWVAANRYVNCHKIKTKPDGVAIIRRLVKHIRFLTLTEEEFLKGQAATSLISDLECYAIIANIASDKSSVPMPEGFSTRRDARNDILEKKMIPVEDCKVVFKCHLSDVTSSEEYFSPKFEMHGVPWRACVRKENNKSVEYLNCTVECLDLDIVTDYRCKKWWRGLEATLSMLRPGLVPHVQKMEHYNMDTFFYTPNPYFITLEELMKEDNNFLTNGTFTLEVKITSLVIANKQNEKVTVTPNEAGDKPKDTSDTPNKTSDTPNNTSDTPNNTSDTPNNTSDTPNNTSDTPNETSNTTNETIDTPYETSDTSYESSEIYDIYETDVITETSDETSESSEEASTSSDEEDTVMPKVDEYRDFKEFKFNLCDVMKAEGVFSPSFTLKERTWKLWMGVESSSCSVPYLSCFAECTDVMENMLGMYEMEARVSLMPRQGMDPYVRKVGFDDPFFQAPRFIKLEKLTNSMSDFVQNGAFTLQFEVHSTPACRRRFTPKLLRRTWGKDPKPTYTKLRRLVNVASNETCVAPKEEASVTPKEASLPPKEEASLTVKVASLTLNEAGVTPKEEASVTPNEEASVTPKEASLPPKEEARLTVKVANLTLNEGGVTPKEEINLTSNETSLSPIEEANVTPNEVSVTPNEDSETPNDASVLPNKADVTPNEVSVTPKEEARMKQSKECLNSDKMVFKFSQSDVVRPQGYFSPQFELHSLSWQVWLCANTRGNSLEYMGCAVVCNELRMKSPWPDKIKGTVSLLRPGLASHSKAFEYNYSNEDFHFADFIKYEDATNPENNYLQNGFFTLEVEIKAEKPPQMRF